MPLRSWSGLLPTLPRKPSVSRGGVAVRLAVIFLPAVLLLLGTLRANRNGNPQLLLFVGTSFQILLCGVGLRALRSGRQRIGPIVLVVYLTGLAWLLIGRSIADLDDWYLHFAQAMLFIVSLVVFAMQILLDSGAPEWRRAQILADRLGQRTGWPTELGEIRGLPDVKAFREALQLDATPALGLLNHPRLEVRIAALAALDFRKKWKPGQAELVLQFARQSVEPAARTAAMSALANVDDGRLIEQLAEFLRDPAPEVRRAASESLLWDTSTRWPWIRMAVRRALADSHYSDEGTLLPTGQLLTAEAVKDLSAWAAEKGFLAIRSALTLGAHYGRILRDQPSPELIAELQHCVVDTSAPPPLRIELARLLREHELLDSRLQLSLLNPLNPASLRLVGADALLEEGDHRGAVDVLHEIAKLPNREIALATAAIVQQRLGVDLGLAPSQPPPPVQSRLAADVTRRVMEWAAQASQPLDEQLTAPR